MELIPVKKSTLATWCRDVELTEEQCAGIRRRTGSMAGIPRDTNRKRREEIARIEDCALTQARYLIGDPTWVAGVVMYWAEGSKTSRRLEIAHSEPEALRLFMRWARQYHEPNAEFAAAMNLHADNDEGYARGFWASELGIDTSHFTKTFVKPDGTGHRKNHLATGVCRVTMRKSTDAFLRTMAWVEFLRIRMGDTITEGR